MAESGSTLLSPENAVDVLAAQIGMQSTSKPIVQMAAYVGSSYILDKLVELATGLSSISSLNLKGFQLQQMQRDIKTIDKNVKILNSGPSKASLDFFVREDYENAYRSAIEGFRDAADIETKVVATWMKILTETMMKCKKNCDKLGTILKTSLDELLDDDMVSECWDSARKQNRYPDIVAKRLESRQNLNQIDKLLSGTYPMLSTHQGWTSPNQDLCNGVSDCVIDTKYIPEGEKDKVSFPIGQLKGEAVTVDIYKTVGNIVKCTVFPNADTTPESSLPTISHIIKSRPSKSQKLKIVTTSKKNKKMIVFDLEAFQEDQNVTQKNNDVLLKATEKEETDNNEVTKYETENNKLKKELEAARAEIKAEADKSAAMKSEAERLTAEKVGAEELGRENDKLKKELQLLREQQEQMRETPEPTETPELTEPSEVTEPTPGTVYKIQHVETDQLLFLQATKVTVTERGREGGWLKSPSILGSDDNHNNGACWTVEKISSEKWFITHWESNRHLFYGYKLIHDGRFDKSGEIRQERGSEKGWQSANKVVGSDANYYNLACWKLVPRGHNTFLIEHSRTGRYLFVDQNKGSGGEGTRPCHSEVLAADDNYCGLAVWEFVDEHVNYIKD